MEICTSAKPDFINMTKAELRVYVLKHRDDEEALHAYLDKLHAENPNPQMYQSEDSVSKSITEYLKRRKQ